VRDSVEGPEHASPWVLFPWLTGHWYFTVKVLAVVAVCAFLAALTWRRRIDLLNCCAGLTVTFACVWLDKGAMNRMDIAIIFAVAATASLGPTLLVALSAITLLAAVAGYAVGLGLLHAALQQVDAVLVLLFLFAYVIGLSLQSPLRVARA